MRYGVLALLLACAPLAAQRPALGLKGFDLTAPMQDCPTETIQKTTLPDGSTLCRLPGGTLAERPVKAFNIQTWRGQILSVGAELASPLDWQYVADALAEKYGRPSETSIALRTHVWRLGNDAISVDGVAGLVLMVDGLRSGLLRTESASRTKKDL